MNKKNRSKVTNLLLFYLLIWPDPKIESLKPAYIDNKLNYISRNFTPANLDDHPGTDYVQITGGEVIGEGLAIYHTRSSKNLLHIILSSGDTLVHNISYFQGHIDHSNKIDIVEKDGMSYIHIEGKIAENRYNPQNPQDTLGAVIELSIGKKNGKPIIKRNIIYEPKKQEEIEKIQALVNHIRSRYQSNESIFLTQITDFDGDGIAERISVVNDTLRTTCSYTKHEITYSFLSNQYTRYPGHTYIGHSKMRQTKNRLIIDIYTLKPDKLKQDNITKDPLVRYYVWPFRITFSFLDDGRAFIYRGETEHKELEYPPQLFMKKQYNWPAWKDSHEEK